ncbi:UNVERIFIED_CONTAM: hypothetical protein H355_007766, partial [Colinus virginianus]
LCLLWKVVALKFIPKVGRSEKELKNLQREIEIMRGLHHPNIIQMLDSFETDKEVVVVTDYAEGELFQILEDDGSLPEDQVQTIAAQLVSALYYLHSHRILHRDMKPQNILLGKDGVIKLCDFGFARAMSIHTMVLTSIKGTPLYMSPELVEERPYDHTADLWSVGCILYELFVGTPPFYTSSIFQLVSLIVKDSVKWPKAISPVFKSFLQGLLMKDPRQRLSWPELLSHPFVAGRVTVIDDTEEHGISNPFTTKLSPELQALKEQQVHSLAPRSGQSRILRKARQKMAEEAQKKGQLKANTTSVKDSGKGHSRHKPRAAFGKTAFEEGELLASFKEKDSGVLQVKSSMAEWQLEECPPSPREHSITQDYEREFPQPESPLQVGVGRAELRGRQSMEAVDLEGEELESDEEWQHLIEATEPLAMQLSTPLSLLKDPTFRHRIQARLAESAQQVLEGMLEGASHLRPLLRVVGNLLATRCDSELLNHFCQELNVPLSLLHLAKQMLESGSTKQQPWCITVLTDLIMVTTAYFSSECSLEESRQDSLQTLQESASHFLALLLDLLAEPADSEMRLCQQSLLVAQEVAGKLMNGGSQQLGKMLRRLEDPNCSLNVLKILYAGCCASPRLCQHLGRIQQVWDLLMQLSKGKVPMEEVAQRMACEASLYLLALLTLQSQASPSRLEEVVTLALDLLTQSHVPSIVGAAAFLLTQLDQQGVPVALEGKEILPAVSSSLMELAEVWNRARGAGGPCLSPLYKGLQVKMGSALEAAPRSSLSFILLQLHFSLPMGAGLYDGLIFLLLKLLSQEDVAVEQSFAASELWIAMWHCVPAVLCVGSSGAALEGDSPGAGCPMAEPDWSLLSPQGTLLFLSLALFVCTRESYWCLLQLTQSHGALMVMLKTLLSPHFLACLAQTQAGEDGEAELVPAVVIQACQLLCFPFALDVDEDTIALVIEAVRDSRIPPQLLQVCCHHLPFSDTELPMSLLCRLVVSDMQVTDQIAREAAASEHIIAYLSTVLFSGSLTLTADLLSLLTHVARTCPEHLPFLQRILGGSDMSYQTLTHLLSHQEHSIRAKTCHLLGNLLRHNSGFPHVLQSQPGLLESLLVCLADEDETVHKAASFAVGNAAYHVSSPASTLGRAVPRLTQLLSDRQAKTRCNAASALGNLGRCSAELGELLIESGVPRILLEVACRDPQASVREGALVALCAVSQHPGIQQVLLSLRAGDQLAALASSDTWLTTRGSPRPSAARHCQKLIQLLTSLQST